MPSAYRFLAALALACTVALATPGTSSAQGDDEYGAHAFFVLGAGTFIPCPFLIAELVYAVKERWLPLGWAVTQLVAGALEVGGAAWLIHDMATTRLDVAPGYWGMTIALGAVGGWLVADSILSLLLYEPPEPFRLRFTAGVSDGVTVGLAGAP
jgi:hypothetical protein